MLQSREFKELRKPEGYPRKIETWGDHIRARRLEQGLTQPEVASAFQVGRETLLGWEKNKHKPSLKHHNNIVAFLGYRPESSIADESTFGEILVNTRYRKGLTQREAAAFIGIDPCILSCYARDHKTPPPNLIGKISQFLKDERWKISSEIIRS